MKNQKNSDELMHYGVLGMKWGGGLGVIVITMVHILVKG